MEATCGMSISMVVFEADRGLNDNLRAYLNEAKRKQENMVRFITKTKTMFLIATVTPREVAFCICSEPKLEMKPTSPP